MKFNTTTVEISGDADFYMEYWRQALSVFFGWPSNRVHQWASQHTKGLAGEDLWFFREPPAHYIIDLIMPDTLRNKLSGDEWRFLKFRLLSLIEGERESYYADGFDFNKAKNSVADLLSQYGATIPRR